ncbi:MAG: hypothetical protein KBC44_00305 [Candidatus Pacebacteria bacterium]|nr:hypothetical protein [Candidatus Levybacteria bacterium]MBP9839407.1 hypothetical protein [Candidatus Paceibacterota bacterium]
MEESNKIEWSALEYEDKERGSDWFWALGVIVIAGSIASIIYKNYFFAGLLILGGILLGFYAKKKPDTIYYELGEKGLRIQNRLYPYDSIKSFFINTDGHPMLLIRSERFFMPIIAIPVNEELGEAIHYAMLERGIQEEPMTEHSSVKVMDRLGF